MEIHIVRSKQRPFSILLVAVAAALVGSAFVQAFTVGWRAVALFPLAAFFLLGCLLFHKHFREFLLFLLVFALPIQFGVHLIHDPSDQSIYRAGIAIDVVDVILAALYVMWIWRVVFSGPLSRPLSVGGKTGIIFIIWLLYLTFTSFLVAKRLDYSIYAILDLVKAFFLYVYLVNNLESEQDLKVVTYGLIAGTVLHSLYICFQYATKLNYTIHGQLSHHYVPLEGFRPVGFTGSWDEAAILLATILAVMVALVLLALKGRDRYFGIILILLVSLGLMLTKMRSAWLAVFIAVVIIVIVGYIKRRLPSDILVKAGSVAAILIILAAPFVVHRMVTGTQGEVREPLMVTAWNMFQDNWVLGVGTANYMENVSEYLPIKYRDAWVSTVHNEYLLRLSENGVIGFLIYYMLFLAVLGKLWMCTRSSNPWIFATALGFFSALVGSIPNRFLTFYHFLSVFMLYCVILAMAHSMGRIGGADKS